MALQRKGKGKVPYSYVEYQICKEFGWTINELYQQPNKKIEKIIRFMDIEQQFREKKQNKRKRQPSIRDKPSMKHGRKSKNPSTIPKSR